jgi:hypothetical protein
MYLQNMTETIPLSTNRFWILLPSLTFSFFWAISTDNSTLGSASSFNILLLGLTFAHYSLGLVYSVRGLNHSWNRDRPKTLLLLLMPLGFIPLGTDWLLPLLVFYFGIHHAISEAYFVKSQGTPEMTQVRTSNWILIIGSYFAIVAKDTLYPEITFNLGWGCIAIGTLSWFWFRRRLPNLGAITVKEILCNYPWIVIGPVFGVLSYYISVDWRVLVLYHVVFYIFLPLARPGMLKGPTLKTYWSRTIFVNVMCLAGMVFLYWHAKTFNAILPLAITEGIFYGWTFIHISWSFLISGANPMWLKKLLKTA